MDYFGLIGKLFQLLLLNFEEGCLIACVLPAKAPGCSVVVAETRPHVQVVPGRVSGTLKPHAQHGRG